MSILTASAISGVAHRAAERSQVPDNRVTRVLGVLLVLGFSGLVGAFGLISVLYLVGGLPMPALLWAALALVAAAPAIVVYSWLDQSESETLF